MAIDRSRVPNIKLDDSKAESVIRSLFREVFNCAKLIDSQDIEITDSAKGIILSSPDGQRWRLTVSNAGALVITNI